MSDGINLARLERNYTALVCAVGPAFHPDNDYDVYDPPLDGIVSRDEYEHLVDEAFTLLDDPHAVTADAIRSLARQAA